MWVLETEPRSSAKIASVLSHLAISPALFLFLLLLFSFTFLKRMWVFALHVYLVLHVCAWCLWKQNMHPEVSRAEFPGTGVPAT